MQEGQRDPSTPTATVPVAATSSEPAPASTGAAPPIAGPSSPTRADSFSDRPTPTSPRRLRSGKVLGEGETVSLDKSLNTLYEEARETRNLTAAQFEQLSQEIDKVRKLRLKQIRNLQEASVRFKEELLKFRGFSRSPPEESSVEINDSVGKLEVSTGEEVLDWLGDSLLESSPEEDSIFHPNFNFPKPPTSANMAVDYPKVVKLASQMIPLFSGAPHPQLSQELQTFLGCCRQVENCLAEEEKAAFLQILPTRLRGEAYQLVTSSSWANLEDLESLLNGTYLPRETYQELVNRLITCKQSTTENFNLFAQRVKQLLGQCKQAAETKYAAAGAQAIKPQLEDFAKTAIKTGAINPHLSAYLLGQTDASLESLIQKALDMERLQMGHPHFHVYRGQALQNPLTSPPPANPYIIPVNNPYLVPQSMQIVPTTPAEFQSQILVPPATQPISSTPTPLDTKAVQPKPAVPTSQTARPSSILSRITCSYCNQKGHTYDECLKRKNTPFCNICKIYNHDARDCRRNRASYAQPPPHQGHRYPNYQPPPQSQQNRFVNSTQQAQNRNNLFQQPHPQNRGGNPSGPSRLNQVRTSCQFCGRRGHTVNNCRQKQRWEARGNPQQSTENPPARL